MSPTGDDTNVTNGRTTSSINLDTEAQIVTSSVVASRADKALGSDKPPRELAKQVAVGVPAKNRQPGANAKAHGPGEHESA